MRHIRSKMFGLVFTLIAYFIASQAFAADEVDNTMPQYPATKILFAVLETDNDGNNAWLTEKVRISLAESHFINGFIDKGYKAIDDKQWIADKAKNTDTIRAIIDGDETLLRKIVVKYGADILVIGKASVENTGNVGGIRSYKATIDLRAVSSHTQQFIFADVVAGLPAPTPLEATLNTASLIKNRLINSIGRITKGPIVVIDEPNRIVPTSIAVMPFKYIYDTKTKGATDQAGILLADKLSEQFIKIPFISTVNRTKLCGLVDEMKIGQEALSDPATAAKIGKLVNAKYIVFGSVEKYGVFLQSTSDLVVYQKLKYLWVVRINLSVLEVETGKLLSQISDCEASVQQDVESFGASDDPIVAKKLDEGKLVVARDTAIQQAFGKICNDITVRCPGCNNELSISNKYCTVCKARLWPMTTVCTDCGLSFSKGDKICSKCLKPTTPMIDNLANIRRQRFATSNPDKVFGKVGNGVNVYGEELIDVLAFPVSPKGKSNEISYNICGYSRLVGRIEIGKSAIIDGQEIFGNDQLKGAVTVYFVCKTSRNKERTDKIQLSDKEVAKQISIDLSDVEYLTIRVSASKNDGNVLVLFVGNSLKGNGELF